MPWLHEAWTHPEDVPRHLSTALLSGALLGVPAAGTWVASAQRGWPGFCVDSCPSTVQAASSCG